MLAASTKAVVTDDALQPRQTSPHPLLKAFEKAQYGQLNVLTPGQEVYRYVGEQAGPAARLELHSWGALDMLLGRGEIGFAEAYMEGLWDSDDLPALLSYGLANADSLERYFYGRPFYALWIRFVSWLQGNSLSGSKRNIAKHYDLGNDFYSLWLDASMTYSCGLFAGDRALSLEDAQQAKYRRILQKLDARSGDHILEIGCGWGGFAEAAARHGLRVTGVTISEEQQHYAKARIEKAGLSGRAQILLQDYRKVNDRFDHIVSIGMFEHVGETYWPTYFQTIKERLRPGGKAMIQTITIDDDVFMRTHGKNGFIETYIFPGGELPSRRVFREAAQRAGLDCQEMFTFGRDYSITLSKWMERFNARERSVRALGYDTMFIRMWRMYLSCCIASFDTGRCDVMQAELTHT